MRSSEELLAIGTKLMEARSHLETTNSQLLAAEAEHDALDAARVWLRANSDQWPGPVFQTAMSALDDKHEVVKVMVIALLIEQVLAKARVSMHETNAKEAGLDAEMS